MGTPLPLPKRGAEPLPKKISAHVYCDQTAGWMKVVILLGMEVGLSPGDFVLDGDPVTFPQKGAAPPNFRPISIVAKRLDASKCHLVWMLASAQGTSC